MADHSISGQWRGHYSYKNSPDAGSGFDAVFRETDGSMEGNIKDDFSPGEASLTGSFYFPSVKFTKTYYTQGYMPIQYEGTMTTDGKTLNGTWKIIVYDVVSATGTWSAYRIDDEEKRSKTTKQSTTKTRELEKVD